MERSMPTKDPTIPFIAPPNAPPANKAMSDNAG